MPRALSAFLKEQHPPILSRLARKDALRRTLSCERARRLIVGNTDSEVAGAVFADRLAGDACARSSFARGELVSSMIATLDAVAATEEEGPCDASSLNLAATDGRTLVATRYRTCPEDEPPSLYYARDARGGLWIASEPLDGDAVNTTREWTMMAKDQLVSYDISTGKLHLRCLSWSCWREEAHRVRPSPAAIFFYIFLAGSIGFMCYLLRPSQGNHLKSQ